MSGFRFRFRFKSKFTFMFMFMFTFTDRGTSPKSVIISTSLRVRNQNSLGIFSEFSGAEQPFTWDFSHIPRDFRRTVHSES